MCRYPYSDKILLLQARKLLRKSAQVILPADGSSGEPRKEEWVVRKRFRDISDLHDQLKTAVPPSRWKRKTGRQLEPRENETYHRRIMKRTGEAFASCGR